MTTYVSLQSSNDNRDYQRSLARRAGLEDTAIAGADDLPSVTLKEGDVVIINLYDDKERTRALINIAHERHAKVLGITPENPDDVAVLTELGADKVLDKSQSDSYNAIAAAALELARGKSM